MRTIRGRIFFSLIIVMIFSVSITLFMFNRLIDGMLMDEAKNQLRIQLQKAINIIEGGDMEDLSSDDLELRFRDHLYYADFFVVNQEDTIVAAGNEDMVGQTIHLSMLKSDHFFQLENQKMMYAHQKLKDGFRIIVYTPMNILNKISDRMLRVSLLSITISFTVILIVGLWFVWKTTRPLQQLKEAVSRYEPSRKNQGMPRGDATEIGQLVDTFSTMSERIRKHHEKQIEFLQNVSHELRTPLMSIQGYALAIKDQVVSVEQGIHVVTTESQRLIQMVDRLLQLTRLEMVHETWKFSLVDVKEMMEQAVQLLSPAANEREVQLVLEGEALEVQLPTEQVFQVILNLMQNAVRYAGGRVVASWQLNENTLRLDVDDDGPGVREEEREAVFERYYMGQTGVSGIGLAICKQIADRLNGSMECTTSPLGGARFTFCCELNH